MGWGLIGGSLIGGMFGMSAQSSANAANAQQAALNRQFQISSMKEAEAFNAAQAKEQMDFQERMSSTQYQRAVGDMTAAGLNPALAYSQGGASSPSGSAGSIGTPSGSTSNMVPVDAMGKAIQNAVSSALDSKRLDNETKTVDAQKALTDAKTVTEGITQEVLGHSAKKAAADAETATINAEVAKAHEAANMREAEAHYERAGYDKKLSDVDSVLDRILPWSSHSAKTLHTLKGLAD